MDDTYPDDMLDDDDLYEEDYEEDEGTVVLLNEEREAEEPDAPADDDATPEEADEGGPPVRPKAADPPSDPYPQPLPRKAYVNDFSHRGATPHVEVSDPGDTLSEPSPAQRERVVFLVDKAIDVLEVAMDTGQLTERLRAAESVLDRAGVAKIHKTEVKDTNPAVPAEAITQVLGGLVTMFGGNKTLNMKVAMNQDAVPIQEEVKKPEPKKKKTQAQQTGLPDSLLNRLSKDKK